MTREQQQATRELERAQENWLRAYGWVREGGGSRWTHPQLDGRYGTKVSACGTFDAMVLTRAQPLVFGAARTLRMGAK
jgi:hypothetical protein